MFNFCFIFSLTRNLLSLSRPRTRLICVISRDLALDCVFDKNQLPKSKLVIRGFLKSRHKISGVLNTRELKRTVGLNLGFVFEFIQNMLTTFCNLYFLFRENYCFNKQLQLDCQLGTRKRTFYILLGNLLSVWTQVEKIFKSYDCGKIQVLHRI